MKSRPWPIIILALLQLLTPISNFGLTYFLFGQGPVEFIAASLKTSPLFFLGDSFGVYLMMAYAIYACRVWSYPVFLGGIGFNLVRTLQAHALYPNQTPLAIILPIFLLNVILVSYFLIPDVRRLFFEARLRWWESKTRYQVELPCTVYYKTKAHRFTIRDISEGGVGLEGDLTLKKWDELYVTLKIYNREFFGRAWVAHERKTASKAMIGVNFEGLDYKNKIALKNIVNGFKAFGLEQTLSPPRKIESLTHWSRQVLKGKELVPTLTRPLVKEPGTEQKKAA